MHARMIRGANGGAVMTERFDYTKQPKLPSTGSGGLITSVTATIFFELQSSELSARAVFKLIPAVARRYAQIVPSRTALSSRGRVVQNHSAFIFAPSSAFMIVVRMASSKWQSDPRHYSPPWHSSFLIHWQLPFLVLQVRRNNRYTVIILTANCWASCYSFVMVINKDLSRSSNLYYNCHADHSPGQSTRVYDINLLFNTGAASEKLRLAGIVDYAAAVALELRQRSGGDEPVIRSTAQKTSRYPLSLMLWLLDQGEAAAQPKISPAGAGVLGVGFILAVVALMGIVLAFLGLLMIGILAQYEPPSLKLFNSLTPQRNLMPRFGRRRSLSINSPSLSARLRCDDGRYYDFGFSIKLNDSVPSTTMAGAEVHAFKGGVAGGSILRLRCPSFFVWSWTHWTELMRFPTVSGIGHKTRVIRLAPSPPLHMPPRLPLA
ncbi:hypothetical protein BDR05DRAFT_953123 [Suillus weaverae]|nr:hypothetical protein BDR05DRAFT_953123 [Suillus weaverae]